MQPIRDAVAAKTSARILTLVAVALCAAGAHAQSEPATGLACLIGKTPANYQTFYLTHTHEQNQFTEIQTILRNMLPDSRVSGISAQDALAICGSSADLQLAQKIIADFDRPHKTWRVTYSFTQADNGRVPHIPAVGDVGSQHISLIVASGERSDLKQGDRVPIVTGSTASDTPQTASQIQYVDVGLSVYANIDGAADSLQLHTKIEQSSIADEKSGATAQDPILHQSVLEVTAKPTPGKPLVLGSIDVPGTTHHEEVEVTVEPIP
jgi:type II secretory pathway component GspD/PulD (secretin)